LLDINCDPEEHEKEEYQSKMKQINKIEQFRHSREEYRLFSLFLI
jgi:hypothetical protein